MKNKDQDVHYFVGVFVLITLIVLLIFSAKIIERKHILTVSNTNIEVITEKVLPTVDTKYLEYSQIM